MAEGARMAEQLGADIIDINMGCPAREVTGKQAGSALMRDLDHAARLVEAVVGAVGVPVTLKMRTRLGCSQPQRAGAGAARRGGGRGAHHRACAHALPVLQGRRPTGPSCARVKEAVRIPVVINGDIVDPATARRPRSRPPAPTRVMVGRGAYGAPWMPARIDATLASGRDPGSPPLARAGRDRAAARGGHAGRARPAARPAHRPQARRLVPGEQRPPGATPSQAWRRRLCTSENAGEVLDGLASFYDEARRRGDGRMNDAARDPRAASEPAPAHRARSAARARCRIPILVLGDDDRVLYANLAAETFFSLSHGMLKRQTLPDIIAFSSPLGALVGQVRTHGRHRQRVRRRGRPAAQRRAPPGRRVRRRHRPSSRA